MFRQFVEALTAQRGKCRADWNKSAGGAHSISSRQLKDQSEALGQCVPARTCVCVRVCVREIVCVEKLCDYNLEKETQKLSFLAYCDILMQVEI